MRIGTGHGNYLAQVSGGNCTGNALSDLDGQPGCITKDVSRAVTWNIAASTILDQVTAKGLSWKSYNESMPSNCARVTSKYVVRPNPAPFSHSGWGFSFDRDDHPQIGNNKHGPEQPCRATTGCRPYVPLLVAGPNYQAGDTVSSSPGIRAVP